MNVYSMVKDAQHVCDALDAILLLYCHDVFYDANFAWIRFCVADQARDIPMLLDYCSIGSIMEAGSGTGSAIAALTTLGFGTGHDGANVALPRRTP